MTDQSPAWNQRDQRLWNLMGVVELSFQPALAFTLLAAIDLVMSPVPVIHLHPLSITPTGQGIPLTWFFAEIVGVDLISDVVGVYATTWGVTAGGRSDE